MYFGGGRASGRRLIRGATGSAAWASTDCDRTGLRTGSFGGLGDGDSEAAELLSEQLDYSAAGSGTGTGPDTDGLAIGRLSMRSYRRLHAKYFGYQCHGDRRRSFAMCAAASK